MGTPVHVTADGVVAVAGQETGYGNVVMCGTARRTRPSMRTCSRFAPALKPGARVSQGDVIGFVGMTGWATGPHLHYEFRVDNVPRNPVTVALPSAEPIADGERATFLAKVKAPRRRTRARARQHRRAVRRRRLALGRGRCRASAMRA